MVVESVGFRVPSVQVIEPNIVFVGARYKHIREENGSTNILLLG
jgi:hypothetical protein